MNLLVNTLSIGSMSGEHVVYGFLRPLIKQMGSKHRLTVLHCVGQAPPADIVNADTVQTIAVSNRLRNWAMRAGWEIFFLPGLIRRLSADRVLNVSGSITPWLRTPQVCLAMNPWCYVKSAQEGLVQRFKAFIQRQGHRLAFRKAEHMVYISDHLRTLYRTAHASPGNPEAPSTIAWVGLDDALFANVQEMHQVQRKPCSILSVSAFAPWKRVATLLQALRILRERGMAASLDLAGPWPDPSYQEQMVKLIREWGLDDAVTIHGKLQVNDLHRLYASRQVYCLMSSSESFGIPAAEAMAFGTPVVSADCCAISEVCEGAGEFGPVDDAAWTARSLEFLLSNPAAWSQCSAIARARAGQLTWQQCSRVLLQVLGLQPSAIEEERRLAGQQQGVVST